MHAHVSIYLFCQEIAQMQSHTTKHCTPKFRTFEAIAEFSQARCNALASTWAACLRDHKQSVPGKLIRGCQLGSYEEATLFNICSSLTQISHFDAKKTYPMKYILHGSAYNSVTIFDSLAHVVSMYRIIGCSASTGWHSQLLSLHALLYGTTPCCY